MQPDSLVQLAGSGNIGTIEQEWARLLDESEPTISNLSRYQPVLAELGRNGRLSTAETLAWSAIDTLLLKHPPAEVLPLAGTFLLALPDSKELRSQTAELYRRVHGEIPGFEALLAEAGLAVGRPVRRAIRTLDVCLSVREGGALVSRDDDGCARVESVDSASWEFAIQSDAGSEQLGAVELADRYRPASNDEFRVLRAFDRRGLIERLQRDPTSIILELCTERGGKITDSELEEVLSPDVLSAAEWKKWWSKARTELKKRTDLAASGRSPITISIVDTPASLEDDLIKDIRRMADPQHQFDRVHRYLGECAARGAEVSSVTLQACAMLFLEQAGEALREHSVASGMLWMMARWAMAKSDAVSNVNVSVKTTPHADPSVGAVTFFQKVKDFGRLFAAITDEELLRLAIETLKSARPSDWGEALKSALPSLSLAGCDIVATNLIEQGVKPGDFEPIVQRIIANPIASFDAMLWLWDGPSEPDIANPASGLTLLTKMLRALDDARRSESIPKERARTVATRARSVLAARNYERFRSTIEGLDPSMISVLRSQVNALESLGRAVKEELLDQLRAVAPQRDDTPIVKPWNREDAIYVTKGAMDRKHVEIETHVNVKMKENARAIGAAAEHGDLSENSEYKFALEERDLLRARLAQMNSEMAIAHVISPLDVSTDHVGIGSRVVFKKESDGVRQEMTFVGPWDADHSRHWYNYKAPLALSIMGKKVGDVVPLEFSGGSGQYKIAEIQNGLADE
ncbi:MAG: GreA/GreB family elongation factor [Planctomycetes bacterium]|nr:GreA/GreB family elongation factor [Planctomycetota bacterium]MBI3835758.1 GreA/GreB family elongation factor [Planctomycetota bacterium]